MKYITITEPVFSQDKYFKTKEQYCYIDKVKMEPSCPLCQECYKQQIITHYRIVIDEVNYYIPEYAAVIADKVYLSYEKDAYKRKIQDNIQPTDIYEEFYNITGRRINNEYKADRNRKKEIEEANFVTYGVADPSLAINTQDRTRETRQSIPACDYEDDVIYDTLNVWFDDEEIRYCGEMDTLTLTPNISGLEDRYTYLWSTGETTRNIEILLEAGDEIEYTITVTDDIGCSKSASIIIAVDYYGSFDESFDCSFDIGCLTC